VLLSGFRTQAGWYTFCCNAEMKIIGFIERNQGNVIERILKYY
jgi:hypothetical protein